MAMFCIPRIEANKLVNSLKSGGLEKISNMKSPERREFFAKTMGKDLARKVNAEFERALASNKKSALIDFAKKITGSKNFSKDVLQRINKLDQKGLLDDNILEDHISEFLGAKITEKEVKQLKIIGKGLEESETAMEKEFSSMLKGDKITKEYKDALIAHAKNLKKADDFLINQTPNDWSSTIWNNAKASMLFNPASWGINIESNLIRGGLAQIERRVENMRMSGYSSDLAKDWKKTMLDVRKQTGYDMSRALSMDEMLQKKVIGEQMSIGKDNIFTKAIYEDALGRPDAWAGRMAFADSLDLNTASLVEGMGLKGDAAKKKAREIFMDGIQVQPKTEEGKLARQIAVQDAQHATWTDSGRLASATLKMKSGLNKFAEESLGLKGFKLGDMIEPFVKTPANVAAYGLDAAGLGIIRGTGKLVSLLKNKNVLTNFQKKKLLGEALKDALTTGFGVGGSLAMASFIKPENFVGAYDPNRWKYEQLRNSNSNSIRIGNKWYSLDYAGGFATPLIAMLYAKKYGNGNPARMFASYVAGVGDQSLNIPFIGSVKDILVKTAQTFDPEDPKIAENTLKTLYGVFNDQVTSRVPGLSVNIAKLFDTTERETAGFLDTLQSKIPVLRNKLPEKQDMLGQAIETEISRNPTGTGKFISIVTQLMAGARIKTAKDTVYGNEIRRLKDVGEPVSLTSWKIRLSEKQEKLKQTVGEDKYREIYKNEYGKEIIKRFEKKLSEERYKKMTDNEKKKILSSVDDDVIQSIYRKYKIRDKK